MQYIRTYSDTRIYVVVEARPEAINMKALAVLNRVKEKLTGMKTKEVRVYSAPYTSSVFLLSLFLSVSIFFSFSQLLANMGASKIVGKIYEYSLIGEFFSSKFGPFHGSKFGLKWSKFPSVQTSPHARNSYRTVLQLADYEVLRVHRACLFY